MKRRDNNRIESIHGYAYNAMLCKICVLKFDLGEKHTDIVIRDVQLWKEAAADEVVPTIIKGRFVQYVPMVQIPIWIQSEEHLCFTTSKTTMAYFSSKLRDEQRGIVIATAFDDPNTTNRENSYIVIYRKEESVCCFKFNMELKTNIDSLVSELIHGGRRVSASDRSNIDEILKKSQRRFKATSSKVSKSVQINDKKLQFNDTLSKLILGGLRLRGIPNTQSTFQKLYKMTFEAAEFTHRDDLQLLARGQLADISFDSLQETVEILLKLFTKS